MVQFETRKARLTRSLPLSIFTKHLEFSVCDEGRFSFVPGQWLSVKVLDPAGEEITRAYSLASSPSEKRSFAFCLNRVQDGFMSNYLCDLREGDEISFQGPFGNFILRTPMSDTLLVATGTGIAPFRSMLQWLFDGSRRDPEKRVWLLFGARYESDLYYHHDFEELAKCHPAFHFVPTLSRGGDDWKGRRGYVQDHLPSLVGARTDLMAYICGLDKMVRANRDLLKAMRWDRKQIIYEKYD